MKGSCSQAGNNDAPTQRQLQGKPKLNVTDDWNQTVLQPELTNVMFLSTCDHGEATAGSFPLSSQV